MAVKMPKIFLILTTKACASNFILVIIAIHKFLQMQSNILVYSTWYLNCKKSKWFGLLYNAVVALYMTKSSASEVQHFTDFL